MIVPGMPGERAQRLPDSMWRTLAERASDGLFVTDQEFRIVWVSPSGQALLGRGLDDLVGHRISDFFFDPPAELARLPLQREVILTGQPTTTVRTFRTARGERRVVEVVATDIGDGHVLGIARDVTARIDADGRIARFEASFRALIENTPDGVVVHDQGRSVYVNAALATMLGYDDPADLIGTSVLEHVHPDDRAAVIARVRSLDAGEPTVPFTEERLRRKDGSWVTASIGGVVVEFAGKPCVAAIARDITEQRRLQARLVEADRLVALGTLSAGIAHEVNNPLTYVMLHQEAILAAVERLRALCSGEALGVVERIAQNVAIAQDGAQRVRHIVRDLRVFSRTDDVARVPIDVRTAIGRALAIAGHELRNRVTVETDLPEVPRVLAIDGRLTQVFLNLIINAAHAVAGLELEHARLTIRTWAEADGRVRASVADTGAGIAPQHLPRLFEPFFTTKPVGEGCGLGLSVAHGIVTALGGTIEVVSELGAGTTFTVTLPAATP
jgi:two-component system NtrC family sensor kinase